MRTIKPMKAEDASKAGLDLLRLCKDHHWAGETKVDGDRVMVHVGQGRLFVASSNGKDARYAKVITKDFEAFRDSPIEWVFDGELCEGKYYIFDLVEAGNLVTADMPFIERREILEQFCERWDPPAHIVLLPSYTDTIGKLELAKRIRENDGEGLMFKRLDASYRPGKRVLTMLKVKFRKDIDCVVVCSVCGQVDCEHMVVPIGNKHNMALSVYRDGKLVRVGECTSLAGDGKRVKVGDVVCVKILNVTKDYKLYQTTFPKIRTDKAAIECTWDQLPPLLVNKTVHS